MMESVLVADAWFRKNKVFCHTLHGGANKKQDAKDKH
jgi:hypothetical protein